MMIVKSKKLILLLSISIVNYNLLECKELKIVSTLSISLEDGHHNVVNILKIKRNRNSYISNVFTFRFSIKLWSMIGDRGEHRSTKFFDWKIPY